MERAIPEASDVRQLGGDLCVDQVRGSLEHRADQRPQHSRHTLQLVTRRTHGPHMLSGQVVAFKKVVDGLTLLSPLSAKSPLSWPCSNVKFEIVERDQCNRIE